MYRCKECGAEYDIKPDYCDCGNDEFEFIGKEPTNQASDIRIVDIEENAETVEKQSVEPAAKPKPQPAPQFKSYNEKTVYKPSIDKISLSIFCLCIILSMYVVLFAWNPKEDNNTITTQKQETAVPKNIPSIDKLWNNTPPKPQVKQTALLSSSQSSTENVSIAPKQTIIKQEPQKVQKQQTVQSKVTAVPLKKATQQTTKSKTTTTNAQKITTKTSAQTSAQSQAEQQKKAAEAQAKLKAEQERKAAETAQIKKLQEEQNRKNAEAKAKQEDANKQELVNYKGSLRNAIGRKIDFTRVIGDGSCTVAFRIDSSGKLINRSFAKQSTNNTLNDEVYAAVMATPAFNPPPSAYKGEVLNLNIRFSNGNFEISLP